MSALAAPAPVPAAGWLEVPNVAPVGPHRKLAEDLVANGHSDRVAEAIARVVVNPSDARRRLATPDMQRTSTAEIYTIPARVWTPLLFAHPDNKRETANRSLPITGATLRFPPLPLVTSDGTEPWLRLNAESPDQLVHALQQAEEFLTHDNPLYEQIGEEGVLRPHTLVAINVSFTDPVEDIAIVSSADGSSRTASAHRNLNLKVRDLLTYLADDRAFRRYVGGLRERAEAADVTEAERRSIRSLTVPADIIVRIDPRPQLVTTSARAVRALVGLMHVQPPKEWSDQAKYDAQGEEIIEELLIDAAITEMDRAYLAGQLTLHEAAEYGLPRHADERAGKIIQTFRRNEGSVKRAIKRVTHQPIKRVTKKLIAKVAAELAMRSYRDPSDGDLQTSRVGLQLAWSLKDAWDEPWKLSLRKPEEIRDAALRELGREGGLGPNQVELAVLGSFELTRVRVLAQYSLTKGYQETNLSSPAAILRQMAANRLGIQTLYQAVAEGRRGAPGFLRVDEAGHVWYSPEGETQMMTARWLRQTFRPDQAANPTPPPIETPETEYRLRQDQIRSTIHGLRAQMTALALVRDDTGAELVRTRGWRPEDAVPLVRELNTVMHLIQQYVGAYRIANNMTFGPEDDLVLADETDEDALE